MNGRNKYRLLGALGIILIVGFLSLSIASYVVSRDAIRAGIVQQELPLTADNIYSEIQKDLLRPVFISSMMAQDTFVRDWLLGGERDVSRISRYLNEVGRTYGTNSAFLVSERSRKHYVVGKGLLKVVSEKDPRDKWYFRVREMQQPYESNVDPDQANHDLLTAFINYRVLDYHGKFIGTAGVGLTLEQVGSHIDHYQNEFNRRIFFVDRNGMIILTGKSMANMHGSIRDMTGIGGIAQKILDGGDAPQQLEYRRGRVLVMVNSRFIPELDSFLLVEQGDGGDIESVWHVLLFNLSVGTLLGLVAFAIMRRVVGRYQQRLESMTGEALAYAARETEMAQEQQDFVAMVSHEFLTPIAIIDSSLQSLKRHEEGMSEAIIARNMRIRRANQRLQELIGNYLAVDRIKPTNFTPGTEHIDIFQLLARTAERIEWFNMDVKIDAHTAIVQGDTELLRIALSNIFSNAIKYSPITGIIQVAGELKDGFAEICIKDSGAGIATEALPHIFDRHFRAADNKASGSGLGLYIVRRIVELHGGTVSADSAPGQGAMICIRLPVTSPA